MRSITRATIAIAALTLVVAACGDDDEATVTSTPVTNDTATATDATTAATAAPATSSPTATSAGVAEDGSEVDDLLARYQMTPVRTTYLLGEGDDQTEIVVAQDPTADPPVESVTIVEAASKIIISEGVTIFCDGSSNMCFEVPGGGGESLATGLLGPFASGVFLTSGEAGVTPGMSVSEEPITVAGRDGVCFTYEAPTDFGSETDLVRQCIDNELGFTLLLQTSNAATDAIETVMELLEFSQPTAEDFEPTGPVTATP